MNVASLLRVYGWWGLLRLGIDVAVSRLMFPQTRIVRRPFYIRGSGKIALGKGFTSGPGLRIDSEGEAASVSIGVDVQVNNNVHIGAVDSVIIGDRVLIASGVFISDHNHGIYSGPAPSSPLVPPAQRPLQVLPVVIEDDVWLGEHVCILPGVRIGKGTIVGAGSVVTKPLPAYTIAVGMPARVIKRFDFDRNVWVAAQ